MGGHPASQQYVSICTFVPVKRVKHDFEEAEYIWVVTLHLAVRQNLYCCTSKASKAEYQQAHDSDFCFDALEEVLVSKLQVLQGFLVEHLDGILRKGGLPKLVVLTY